VVRQRIANRAKTGRDQAGVGRNPGESTTPAPSLPRPAAASEPTDAELERGILDAVRLGLADVARTLSVQLEERRRNRLPANVVRLERKG
jgi:hypothetical protein